jgi:hypothetical protein
VHNPDGGPKGARQPNSEGVRPDERLDDLYDEFCRTFCIRPGVPLIEYLRAQGVTRLADWLHPSTNCALPKGFIRLAVDATRKGSKIWEVDEPIRMRYEGNWTAGGGLPPQESRDALSVLSQVLKIPISLYYTEIQGGPLMVMGFEP